jgi:hypothetical protein
MFEEKDQGFHSGLGIKELCHLQLFGPDGQLKEERVIHNTVTELGDAHVADQMSDSGEAALGFMAVGTGSGQTAASVGLAVSLDRNALTSTTQGAGAADNDVIWVGTWIAGDGTGAITEAGIFLADNNTTMNYYADFAAVNKLAADSLVITWTGTYGAS